MTSIYEPCSKLVAALIETKNIIFWGRQKQCVPTFTAGRHLQALLCVFGPSTRELGCFFLYADCIDQISTHGFLRTRLCAQVRAAGIADQQSDHTTTYIEE